LIYTPGLGTPPQDRRLQPDRTPIKAYLVGGLRNLAPAFRSSAGRLSLFGVGLGPGARLLGLYSTTTRTPLSPTNACESVAAWDMPGSSKSAATRATMAANALAFILNPISHHSFSPAGQRLILPGALFNNFHKFIPAPPIPSSYFNMAACAGWFDS
jgi:hypothetical protein